MFRISEHQGHSSQRLHVTFLGAWGRGAGARGREQGGGRERGCRREGTEQRERSIPFQSLAPGYQLGQADRTEGQRKMLGLPLQTDSFPKVAEAEKGN